MKNLNLTIPKPCNEKWENFTTTANGGFCSSCSKTVVDFTTMGDAEIIGYFKQNSGTCGRFRSDQLKSYVSVPPLTINPGVALFKAGLFCLLFLLLSKPGPAQTPTEKPKTEVVDHKRHPVSSFTATPTDHWIKGIVLSGDDNTGIPGTNVVLQGTDVGTITDVDGRFEFPQKLKEGDVLLFYFIGYMTEQYKVPKEIADPFEIKMTLDIQILGEVAVDEVYSVEPTGLRKLWMNVKRKF